MTKLALITDTHWGVRGDHQAFYKYFDEFYSEQFFPYCIENNITDIIHLGDIVDRRKYINYVTLHNFRKTFILPIIENEMNLHCIVGNHDIPYRNTNHINAMEELFNESCIKVYDDPTEITFDGIPILFVPWINPSNHDTTFELIEKTKAQILFGHLEISGFSMYRGMKSHEGMRESVFDKFDVVASGHFHHKSSRGNIHYLGSPYEMTWSDYDDNRGFHIFDTDTRRFDFQRNTKRMFRKLYYDDMNENNPELFDIENSYVKIIVINKNDPYRFDTFLDSVYLNNPLNVQIVDDHKNMHEIDDDEIIGDIEDTRTVLSNYVNALKNPRIDSSALNSFISTLYTEAQNIEI